jgi:hypothetical protein
MDDIGSPGQSRRASDSLTTAVETGSSAEKNRPANTLLPLAAAYPGVTIRKPATGRCIITLCASVSLPRKTVWR